MLIFTTKTTSQQGPLVDIDCPACGATDVPAKTSESVEVVKIFFFTPILRLRNTYLRCTNCQTALVSTAPLDQLADLTPEEISGIIRYKPSRAGKILAIVALLTCLLPYLGLIIAAIACYLTRGTKGWAKKISFISIIIALTITTCLVGAMLIEK
jgi:hypothetical protein